MKAARARSGPGTRLLGVVAAVVALGALLYAVVYGIEAHQQRERCAAVIAETSRFIHLQADNLRAVAESEERMLPSDRKLSPPAAARSEARIHDLRARAAALEGYLAALHPGAPLPDRTLLDPADRRDVDALYEGPDAKGCAEQGK